VPRRRGKSEPPLEAALEALRRALDETGARWMVIGGIAVIARGVHRLTTDIDATVRGDDIDVGVLLQVLSRHGIEPRIKDAEAFARTNLVLILQHTNTGVSLDVSLAWTGFEHAALAARTDRRFGRISVPMPTVEALVIYKVIAARPKDLEDAETLLLLYPAIDVAEIRRWVTALAEGADLPELLDGLDRVVASVQRASEP